MTGIGHTLNIARGALSAQQYGLTVAGHNIANVNTPSFSRQSLSMTTSIPILYGGLVFGSGVLAEDILHLQQVRESRPRRILDAPEQCSLLVVFQLGNHLREGNVGHKHIEPFVPLLDCLEQLHRVFSVPRVRFEDGGLRRADCGKLASDLILIRTAPLVSERAVRASSAESQAHAQADPLGGTGDEYDFAA